jgi:hypothetical protein
MERRVQPVGISSGATGQAWHKKRKEIFLTPSYLEFKEKKW